VADFGIALAASRSEGAARMTETGMSLGTPHYMAPEQAMGERDITPRADIYALGCVLYEMLTGEPPFTGPTARAIVARVMTEQPHSLTLQRHTIPPELDAVVMRALEKLPADRFASAAAFSEALANPAAGTARTTHVSHAPPAAAGRIGLVPWVIAVVAAATAVASWTFRHPGPDLRPYLLAVEPPAGTEYSEFRFGALSPDGRRFAFVGLGSTGGRQLWLRDLETGRLDSLPPTRGAEAPFWSPDGLSLGYFALGALLRLDLDSRVPRQLCPASDVGGSWSSRDLILFTVRGRPMTVSANGGACEPVRGAWSDSALRILRPAWFPDGRHFAGADPNLTAQSRGILRSSVDGTALRRFIEVSTDVQFVAPDLVVYSREGMKGGADVVAQRFDPGNLTLRGAPTTLAGGVRAAGVVASYAVTGSSLAYLPTARVDEGPLVVDAHGRVLDSIVQQGAWTMRQAWNRPAVALGGLGLWIHDLARHTTVPVKPNGIYMFPVWSPGDSLLAAAGPKCSTVMVRLGTGADTTLINGSVQGSCFVPTDWTSDGRFLVLAGYGLHEGRRGEIWTLAIKTGELEPLLAVDGTASAGAVSPDRRWLAYVSDETGDLQVYVRPFRQSGAAVRVSTAGGGLPRWRRDGRALYYQAPDGSIVRVTVAAGASLHLGASVPLFRAPRWSARLFADQMGGQQKTTTYDLSPDGERFLVRQRNEGSPAAVLLLNWQRLLDAPSHDRSK
jgi:Tol biopolymer transport system component